MGHCILLTLGVSIYLVSAWLLCHSDKALRCLLGLILFMFYAVIVLDIFRFIITEDPWFRFTEGVLHGSIGVILLYGTMIWIALVVNAVRKDYCKQ